MIRSPLSLGLVIGLALAAAPAAAAPPSASSKRVARELSAGKLEIDELAARLDQRKVEPSEAIAAIRAHKIRARIKPGPSSFTLTDEHQRTSRVEVFVPRKPREDGRYGVLIVLHGLGGHAKQLMAFAQRIAPPGTIVVAPNAQHLGPKIENEDVPKFGKRSLFPHWWRYRQEGFPLAALRHVKQHYPIDTNRVLLTGYSMGGYGTWNTGLRFPSHFAAIAPFAGGLSRLEAFVPRDTRVRAILENARTLPAFFVHGDSDRTVNVRNSRLIKEDLAKFKAPFVYEEVAGGGHILGGFLRGNEVTQRLIDWLKAQKRDPWPKAVSHTALGAYAGRRAWVRMDRVQGKVARLQAEVIGPNRIRLEGENVLGLTLFLSPRLVDLSKPVQVEWGGRILHAALVPQTSDAVAESWRDAEDPELLAPAMLRLEPSVSGEL